MNGIKPLNEVFSCEESKRSMLLKLAHPFRQSSVQKSSCIGNSSNFYSKESVTKYLYTFAFEIGFDLPSEAELKSIYFLLQYTQEFNTQMREYNQNYSQVENTPTLNSASCQRIPEQNFLLLIELCIKLYLQSKRSNIGGIFERIIISLKKELYCNRRIKEDGSVDGDG